MFPSGPPLFRTSHRTLLLTAYWRREVPFSSHTESSSKQRPLNQNKGAGFFLTQADISPFTKNFQIYRECVLWTAFYTRIACDLDKEKQKLAPTEWKMVFPTPWQDAHRIADSGRQLVQWCHETSKPFMDFCSALTSCSQDGFSPVSFTSTSQGGDEWVDENRKECSG